MAATELTPAPTRHVRAPGGAAGALLAAYTALWLSTLGAAALVLLSGPGASETVRRALGLTLTPADNPPPTLGHVLGLAAHNLPVAAWPLLLGLSGAARSRRARRATDALVLACAAANTIPVGAAIGAYGAHLLPYIPQLPLEWAALASGYGSWLLQRQRALDTRRRLAWLGLTSVLVLLAAAVETAAVPQRRGTPSSRPADVQRSDELRAPPRTRVPHM